MSAAQVPRPPDGAWDSQRQREFFRYYESAGGGDAARRRFAAIEQRLRPALATRGGPLQVADIGCGAGTQCQLWAERGHQVYGVDINRALISLARKRARESGLEIGYDVASATALPWPDRSMDVCLAPGLLEHVADWRSCLAELVRVLKPGGVLYLSTSNRLCPRQHEFALPLYSWYPGFVKRRCVQLARTTRPQLAGYAAYPAVNWFTWYGLRTHLARHDMCCFDVFDLASLQARGRARRAALALVRTLAPLRFCAHMARTDTVLLAFKQK